MNGTNTDGSQIDVVTAGGAGFAIQDNQAGANIIGTNDCAVSECGLAVGNNISVRYIDAGAAPQTHACTITAMADAGGKVQLTVNPAVPAGNKTVVNAILASDSRALRVRPQFRLLQVAPTDAVIKEMSKGLAYSFTSYDYFVDSLISSVRKHLIELNSVATKAVCVMTSFSDGNKLEDQLSSSYFVGETAGGLNMDSVQYFLKGRLAPVRSYDPRVNQEKIIAQNELSKALTTLNLEPKDLGNTDGKNIEEYTNVFAVARQLARRGYYYNLREAEGQVRLGFSAARANNVITNTWVWSQKVVVVDPSGELNVVL